MSLEVWVELVRTLGVPVAVVLGVLVLMLRGKLHTDNEFQEMKKDRDWYRALAYKATHAGENIADLAKQVTADRDAKADELATRIAKQLKEQGQL